MQTGNASKLYLRWFAFKQHWNKQLFPLANRNNQNQKPKNNWMHCSEPSPEAPDFLRFSMWCAAFRIVCFEFVWNLQILNSLLRQCQVFSMIPIFCALVIIFLFLVQNSQFVDPSALKSSKLCACLQCVDCSSPEWFLIYQPDLLLCSTALT